MRTEYAYIGSGRILARKRGTNAPFRELGNCSALSMGVEQETKKLRDFRTAGGGTYAQVDRITGVTLSVTAHDLSPENIALALYGTTDAVAAGAVVDEEHATFKGGYIVPDQPIDTTVEPVLTSMDGVTTYTVDTDYVLQYGAIFIPSTSTIPDATDVDTANVKLSYTNKAGDLVQALTSSAEELELVFLGLNEAASGKEVRVDMYRAQFGATQALPLIGDDFASLELSGAVLPDGTKTGELSQYFQAFVEE